ncbi:MAG: ribose transporter permease [Armatimonadetes bacterium]|nr:ribose transporter permease [Armatimonadota bacterium]
MNPLEPSPNSPPPAPAPTPDRSQWLLRWATQLGIFAVILLLGFVFSRAQPGFLGWPNVTLIFKYYSPVAVLALGMTFVVLTGGIDLSVGFLMMFLMFVMAGLVRKAGIDPALGLVGGFGAAVVVGGLVGACVAFARIPSFIVSLAVMVGAYGATLLISGNQSITNLPPALEWLGSAQLPLAGGQQMPVLMPAVILLYLIAGLVLDRTTFGRYVYAVGSNREAARLNGVAVGWIELSVYVISACCAWLAGLMQLGINHTADPKVATSDNLELNAIAMVVIGGTSLTGGRGGLVGTALGAVLLSMLFNGLPMLGGQFGDTSWRKLVQAGVIFLGAILDAAQRRYFRR